jgi:methionyl-tRNA synthetase
MSEFKVDRAVSAIFQLIAESNRHLQQLAPWLSTSSASAVHRALFYSSETLRISAILLQPFMPEKAHQLLDTLGVANWRRGWSDLALGEGGERTIKKGKCYLFPVVKLESVTVE